MQGIYELKHGREHAEAYAEGLTGSPTTPLTFQTFADDPAQASARNLCRILHGSIAKRWRELLQMNRRGAGIFVMVNEGDGHGRAAKNVTGLRALFVDDDDHRLDHAALPLPPSLVVRSQAGHHVYWRLRSGEPLAAFTSAQEQLARALGTDPKVKDLPRVMRLPGLLHLKDPAHPVPVKVVARRGVAYSIAEVLAAFPAPPPEPARPVTPLRPAAGQQHEPLAVRRRAEAYVRAMPPSVSGSGGHQALWNATVALLRGFNLSTGEAREILLCDFNPRCQPSWSEREIEHKLVDVTNSSSVPPGYLLAEGAAR